MTLEELQEMRSYFSRIKVKHDNDMAANVVQTILTSRFKELLDLAETALMLHELAVDVRTARCVIDFVGIGRLTLHRDSPPGFLGAVRSLHEKLKK